MYAFFAQNPLRTAGGSYKNPKVHLAEACPLNQKKSTEHITVSAIQSSVQMAKYILISTLALCMGTFLTAAMPVHHMERRQDRAQNHLNCHLGEDTRQNFLNCFLYEYEIKNFSSNTSVPKSKDYYACKLTAWMKLSQLLAAPLLNCSVSTCKH